MEKGISTIIASLLMLIITIALAGFAYTYISGVLTQRTSVVLSLYEVSTTCNGGTNAITVGVTNDGTNVIALSAITISGTNSAGSAITSAACAASGNLNAGTTVTCTNTVTGSDGTNTIVVSGSGSVARGTVFCS